MATTGSLLAVFAEGVELVCDVLGDGEALFDPADFAAGGADFEPAAGVLEDDELFAVGGLAGAVGDGGDAVAEEGLFGGDVDVVFFGLALEVGAAGEGAGDDRPQHEARETPVRKLREDLLHEDVMPLRVGGPVFRVSRSAGGGGVWADTAGAGC